LPPNVMNRAAPGRRFAAPAAGDHLSHVSSGLVRGREPTPSPARPRERVARRERGESHEAAHRRRRRERASPLRHPDSAIPKLTASVDIPDGFRRPGSCNPSAVGGQSAPSARIRRRTPTPTSARAARRGGRRHSPSPPRVLSLPPTKLLARPRASHSDRPHAHRKRRQARLQGRAHPPEALDARFAQRGRHRARVPLPAHRRPMERVSAHRRQHGRDGHHGDRARAGQARRAHRAAQALSRGGTRRILRRRRRRPRLLFRRHDRRRSGKARRGAQEGAGALSLRRRRQRLCGKVPRHGQEGARRQPAT